MLKKYDLADANWHENIETMIRAACYGLISHEDVYWYETEADNDHLGHTANLYYEIVEYLEERCAVGILQCNFQKLVEVALSNPEIFDNPKMLDDVEFDFI